VIRTIVFGAGRMAHEVVALISASADFELVAIVCRTRPEDDATRPWDKALERADLEQFDAAADLLIDFTLPGGTALAAAWCECHGVAFLSGTTGLADEDFVALKRAALVVPVLWAPNMSYGVALMNSLVRHAAEALGVKANITISDLHHENKRDAPSGTALALGASVMEGRQQRLEDLLDPQALQDMEKQNGGELTFSSVREGHAIGEHTVSFGLRDEVIEITHKALSRDVFASGALSAGRWLVTRAPGYYSSSDWLDQGD